MDRTIVLLILSVLYGLVHYECNAAVLDVQHFGLCYKSCTSKSYPILSYILSYAILCYPVLLYFAAIWGCPVLWYTALLYSCPVLVCTTLINTAVLFCSAGLHCTALSIYCSPTAPVMLYSTVQSPLSSSIKRMWHSSTVTESKCLACSLPTFLSSFYYKVSIF